MSRYCPKCFTELPEKANYCPTCGECMREVKTFESGFVGKTSTTEVVGFHDKALRMGEQKN